MRGYTVTLTDTEYDALKSSLASYQAARVHDVDEKAWLSKRVTELEAALTPVTWECCVFEGDPPPPYTNWLAWANSRDYRNVTIKATPSETDCEPVIPCCALCGMNKSKPSPGDYICQTCIDGETVSPV